MHDATIARAETSRLEEYIEELQAEMRGGAGGAARWAGPGGGCLHFAGRGCGWS